MTFNLQRIGQYAGAIVMATGTGWLVAQLPASAFSLNGWDYALGEYNNGVTLNQVGGGVFEIYGIAIKDTGSQMTIAVNANLPLTGQQGITYGDLFFNFTGQSFKAASDAAQLFGVRFVGAESDSGAPTIGLYSNVMAKNVSATNSGFVNLQAYSLLVQGNDRWGDMNVRDPYFAGQDIGNWTVLNAIGTGTKISEIDLLTAAALTPEGLDFAQFPGVAGSQTIGVRFDKPSQFGIGRYVASLMAECANDGIVIQSESVPEPTTMAGLGSASVGLALLRRRLKMQKLKAQKASSRS